MRDVGKRLAGRPSSDDREPTSKHGHALRKPLRRSALNGTMSRPLEVSEVRDFRREVEQSADSTVVMFTTSWCPFCRRFKPQFVEAASKSDVRTVMAYIDDWENPLWDEYHIDVVPTLVLFERGKPVYRRDGVLGRGLGGHDIAAIVDRAAGLATA